MPKNLQEFINGLTILGNSHEGNHFSICSEHDIILFDPDVYVSDMDRVSLEMLGFHWSTEYDCWAYFT